VNAQTPSSGYLDTLRQRARTTGAPVCFGMDPEIERLPPGPGAPGERVAAFYLQVLERMERRAAMPALVKPNLAYYERLGPGGLDALGRILAACRALGLPVLLDAKRGDIGSSSGAYAAALFEQWGADAVTVSPYMGGDSLSPFTAWCGRGRGVYVLCRTSNPGAAELQDLLAGGRPLHEHVAGRICGSWYREGIGAVVGATAPEPLERLARLFAGSGRPVSMLLPGIGSQGGSAREVARRLRAAGQELEICLFSASSSIAEAARRTGGSDWAEAAADALGQLQDEIRKAWSG
jgi:orotidine-5'-phosphate decarboxylase